MKEWRPSLWEGLRYWFIYWIVLPIRAWRVRVRQWGKGLQRCKVCGVADGIDFTVPDNVWEAVTAPRFNNNVVCLSCFDHMAHQRGVYYAGAVREVCFVGEGASLVFRVSKAIDRPKE